MRRLYYQEKVPSLGKVHLACLSVMTQLILPAPTGLEGKIISVGQGKRQATAG